VPCQCPLRWQQQPRGAGRTPLLPCWIHVPVRSGLQSGAFFQNAPLVRSTKSGQPNREKWARFARTRPLAQDLVLCAPRWLRYCRAPTAARRFGTGRCASTPRRTRPMASSRASTAQSCSRPLAAKTLQHQAQQLEHPHQCPVCDKRFRSKMVQHHGTHNADDETAQQAASRVGDEVMRLAQAIRGGLAEVGRPTVTCTTCKGATTRHYLRARSTGRVEGWPPCQTARCPVPSAWRVSSTRASRRPPLQRWGERWRRRAEARTPRRGGATRRMVPVRRQGHGAGRSSRATLSCRAIALTCRARRRGTSCAARRSGAAPRRPVAGHSVGLGAVGLFTPHCRLSPIDPFTLSRATWDG
jgi:hypothetical protein